jgi:hypothetical protein
VVPESAEAERLNALLGEQVAVLQRLREARETVYGRSAIEEASAAKAAEEAASAARAKAAAEAEKAWAKESAARKKALQALLDDLDPIGKAIRKYDESVVLLEKSLGAGEITARQYAEALDEAAEAATNFYAIASGKGQEPVDTTWGQAFDSAFDQAGQDLGRALEYGMADTFRTLAQNGDVKDALEMFSSDVSAIFGGAISTGLMDALFGYTDENGKKVSGSVAIGESFGKLSRSQQVGVGLASMAGQYLYSSGMQRNDQGQAALGGAMTGAATGFTIGSAFPGAGNIIGAVIGAIVGGVAAYFASGSKSTDYHMWGTLGLPTWMQGTVQPGGFGSFTSDVTGYGNL